METTCSECGKRISSEGARGPVKRLCGARCRKAASRRKRRERVGVVPPAVASSPRWFRSQGGRPISPRGTSVPVPSLGRPLGDVFSGPGDGFGVMVGDGLGVVVLAGGHAGGVLASWARGVLDDLTEPVLFVDVAGDDVHAFVSAEEGRGRRWGVPGGRVEFYSRGRFIPVALVPVGRVSPGQISP